MPLPTSETNCPRATSVKPLNPVKYGCILVCVLPTGTFLALEFREYLLHKKYKT